MTKLSHTCSSNLSYFWKFGRTRPENENKGLSTQFFIFFKFLSFSFSFFYQIQNGVKIVGIAIHTKVLNIWIFLFLPHVVVLAEHPIMVFAKIYDQAITHL